jgi:hypothetical protein
MVRSLYIGLAAALTLVAATAADAQAIRHPRHAHYAAIRPGDIVVHPHRSYLDPGVAASGRSARLSATARSTTCRAASTRRAGRSRCSSSDPIEVP